MLIPILPSTVTIIPGILPVWLYWKPIYGALILGLFTPCSAVCPRVTSTSKGGDGLLGFIENTPDDPMVCKIQTEV